MKVLIITLAILIANNAYAQIVPPKLLKNKGTGESCYDLVIWSDSLPVYYINIDWKEKCARVVVEDKRKKTRDTMYLMDVVDCNQSKGILRERLKKLK